MAQQETTEKGQSWWNKPISRRGAIKQAAEAAGVLVVSGTLLGEGVAIGKNLEAASQKPETDIVEAPTRSELPSPEDRLRSVGLGDFVGVYKRMGEFYEKFRAFPTITDAFFRNVCVGVVTGANRADNVDVVKARDGWAESTAGIDKDERKKILEERRNKVEQKAAERIDSINIKIRDAKDTPDEIRDYLRKIAKVFPVHVAALPDDLEVVDKPPAECNFKCGGYSARDKVVMPSQYEYGEEDFKPWIHELDHTFDFDWNRIKEFVERAEYARYYESYLDYTMHVAEEWFGNSYDVSYPAPLYTSGRAYTNEEVLKTDLDNIQSRFFPDLTLPEGTEKNLDVRKNILDIRRNMIVHQIGARFLRIHRSGNATGEDLAFMENEKIKAYMQETLSEIMHYFVDPVNAGYREVDSQSAAGIIAEAEDLKKALNEQRVASFSTLRTDASWNEFRVALGLPIVETKPVEKKGEFEGLLYAAQLPEFGCRELGEYKYSKDGVYKLFEMPDNPYTPSEKMILVLFRDRLVWQQIGCLLTVPKEKYDPNMVDRKSSFDPEYSKRLLAKYTAATPDWIELIESSSSFSFRTAEDSEVIVNLNLTKSFSPLNAEIKSATDQSSETVNVLEITGGRGFPDAQEQIASSDLVIKGGFQEPGYAMNGLKGDVSSGKVLYLDDEGQEIRLFPLPDEVAKHGIDDIFYLGSFHGKPAFVMVKAKNGETLVIPDGSLKAVLGTRERGDYFPIKDGNLYYFGGPNPSRRFSLNFQMERRLEEILELHRDKIDEARIDVKIITPDEDDSSKTYARYYLIYGWDEKDRKMSHEKFPLRFVKE